MNNRHYVSLTVLIFICIARSLNAEDFTFEQYKCRLSLPDSGWSRSPAIEKSGIAKGDLIFAAENATMRKKLVVTVVDASMLGDIDSEGLQKFVSGFTGKGGRLIDSGLTTLGGVPAFFMHGVVMGPEGPAASSFVVAAKANGSGFQIVSYDLNGRKADDPGTMAIVRSFRFTDTPVQSPQTGQGSPDWWGRMSFNVLLVAAAGYGIWYSVRRKKRKEKEDAENDPYHRKPSDI